ncbi:MAG: DUF1540 domain-containing protein [Clostridia bacterium]
MVDLKCKRVGCTHNCDCNCNAKEIKVNSSAECKTYKAGEKVTKPVTDIVSQKIVRPNVDVTCSAPCIFNKNNECIANGITVCTEHKTVSCSSFMPK